MRRLKIRVPRIRVPVPVLRILKNSLGPVPPGTASITPLGGAVLALQVVKLGVKAVQTSHSLEPTFSANFAHL